MIEKMEERFENLKQEYKAGEHLLQQKKQEIIELTTTLARISGAIQVLEELLADKESDD